jgi:hypothetical protein
LSLLSLSYRGTRWILPMAPMTTCDGRRTAVGKQCTNSVVAVCHGAAIERSDRRQEVQVG